MADLDPVYTALQKADAAGDTAGAKKLADYIRSQQPQTTEPAAPTQTRDQMIGEANAKANRAEQGPFADVTDFAKGLVKGGLKTAGNIATAVEHPIDTAGAAISAIPKAASAVAGAIAHPIDTLQAGAEAVKNATPTQVGEQVGSLAVGGAAGKAAGVLGDVVGPAAKAAIAGTAKAASPAVTAARAAGYVLKPSEAGGKIGKTVEGLTGSPRMSIEASLKNQLITNKLAATEIGLTPGTKLTRSSLRKAKEPHNAVYKEASALGEIATDEQYDQAIASIGRTPGKSFKKAASPEIDKLREAYAEKNFEASDAILEVRRLRAASSKNIKAPLAPAQNELGYAQKQIADAIENQIERHAAAMGQPELVERLRAARQSLAKIHSVETALTGNTGDVSASTLARMQKKGVPLSGNLKLIADTHDEFGEVMRDASKLKNKVPVTVFEGGAGVLGAAMTAAHSPAVGVPLMAGMVSRPAARKLLMSERYQSKLAPGPKGKTIKKPKSKTRNTLEDLAIGAPLATATLSDQSPQQ